MPALLFGSISTLADTSELQRQAFNDAFAEHGLDWTWDREEYQRLLTSNGGAARIAEQASSRGQDVDADAVHATKSRLFQERLATTALQARPGVVDTMNAAREQGIRLGLVTTTSPENVAALLTGLRSELGEHPFDVVVDRSRVETGKPDPQAYTVALQQLGEPAGACVAVEDNVGGVRSAMAAGMDCLAFPNENTVGHSFPEGARVVHALEPSALPDTHV